MAWDVKTVSSMLGHYDAGFTLRTYTHATRQKQDEAAQTTGSFIKQVMWNQNTRRNTEQEVWPSCPVPFEPFRTFRRLGHGVGLAVDPYRDLHKIMQEYNEKHPISEEIRCFLELLGGF